MYISSYNETRGVEDKDKDEDEDKDEDKDEALINEVGIKNAPRSQGRQ